MNELSRNSICKEIDLKGSQICPQSEYGNYAFKNNFSGVWCSVVCKGEYRLYKVNDGERHWVWANSKQQIKDYWLKEYGEEVPEEIDPVTYGNASKNIHDEDGNVFNLIDVVFKDYQDCKELCVIASTVY